MIYIRNQWPQYSANTIPRDAYHKKKIFEGERLNLLLDNYSTTMFEQTIKYSTTTK